MKKKSYTELFCDIQNPFIPPDNMPVNFSQGFNHTLKSKSKSKVKHVKDHIILNYGTGNVEGLMA